MSDVAIGDEMLEMDKSTLIWLMSDAIDALGHVEISY